MMDHKQRDRDRGEALHFFALRSFAREGGEALRVEDRYL